MLVGHLSKRGHDVVVVGYSRLAHRSLFSEEALRLEEKGIQCYSAEGISISIPNFVTEFPYFLSFGELVEEVRPDIIHINCLPFLTSFQAARIAKKTRRKSVLQVHGMIGERGFLFNTLQELYNSTFGHQTFHNVDKVVALTISDVRKIFRYGCPLQKIHVIPNGVNVNQFHPSGSEEPRSLFWCGRFVHEKGLEYLIEAVGRLERKEKHKPIRLVMAGDGPALPRVYELVRKKGLTRSVVFLGRRSHEDMPNLMNKSSIYVLPSLKEGMPYALLEAMACGKPVIGSDISGVRDVVTNGENGLLVPPRDTRALADAILTLLEDENLRKIMGRKARELMVRKYSWDAVAVKMEKVYQEQ